MVLPSPTLEVEVRTRARPAILVRVLPPLNSLGPVDFMSPQVLRTLAVDRWTWTLDLLMAAESRTVRRLT